MILTHWSRVTHICVGNLTIIGADNGLSPERRQAIIWTNAGILLIGPLRTNFSDISIGIQTFSFKKMHFKMSSAKRRPFCLGLNVLWQTDKGTTDMVGCSRLLQWRYTRVLMSQIIGNSTLLSLAYSYNNKRNMKSVHHWPFVREIHHDKPCSIPAQRVGNVNAFPCHERLQNQFSPFRNFLGFFRSCETRRLCDVSVNIYVWASVWLHSWGCPWWWCAADPHPGRFYVSTFHTSTRKSQNTGPRGGRTYLTFLQLEAKNKTFECNTHGTLHIRLWSWEVFHFNARHVEYYMTLNCSHET